MCTKLIAGLLFVTALLCAPGCDHRAAPRTRDLDAVILALRAQTTIALDEALATELSAVLARARAALAPLSDVHAFPYEVRSELMVTPRDPRVAAAWSRGALDSGVATLDALLSRYAADAVARGSETGGWFVLRFGRPLKLAPLARVLSENPAIARADPNTSGRFIGLSYDDIRAARDGRGGWQLTVERGGAPRARSCAELASWRVDVPAAAAAAVSVMQQRSATSVTCRP